ncbi:MAG TPA: hypothetical protein VHS27_17015 [Gaiellales bacterium]|nr:hypothetical protein [Gaiellales bacterium]
MLTWRTFRLVVLVAMLFSFLRAVIGHAPDLGPLEWVASVGLVLVLVAAIVPVPRRA